MAREAGGIPQATHGAVLLGHGNGIRALVGASRRGVRLGKGWHPDAWAKERESERLIDGPSSSVGKWVSSPAV
jgi:hypothetical protein